MSQQNIEKQKKYSPASEVCNELNTVVPSGMAKEQQSFNESLKVFMFKTNTDVDNYVVTKLKYKNIDDLCNGLDRKGNIVPRFAREQIDAIATAIYNYEEKGDSIILADQTGIGKGRVASGLLRYAVLTLGKTPLFITEKDHLINDIYRDLYDIGLDAGVPIHKKVSKDVSEEDKEYTDQEIFDILVRDIKNDSLKTEIEMPDYFDIVWLTKSSVNKPKSTNYEELVEMTEEAFQEVIESVKEDAIETYRTYIAENGIQQIVIEDNLNYEAELTKAYAEGRIQLLPFRLNKTDVKNKQGEIIYKKITDKEYQNVYKQKENPKAKIGEIVIPSQYKIITLTYSQLQTSLTDAEPRTLLNKIKLLMNYAQNGVVIMDEAHNGAGINSLGEQSKTGELLFKILRTCDMATYISATFAKKPSSMPLYALKTSIRESGLDTNDMILGFIAGGNAIQEAVSAELTKNGQLVRREKLIEGVSLYDYAQEATDIGDNQIAKLNKVARLIYGNKETDTAGVMQFSDKVGQVIRKYAKREGVKIKHSGSTKRLQFLLFNFFLLGIKINQTVANTLKYIKEGKKPIIAIANTMESALNNMSKSFMMDDDKYEVGDEIRNDFILYVAYLLQYTMKYSETVTIVDDKGREIEEKSEYNILTDKRNSASADLRYELIEDYTKMLRSILTEKTNIPIAPIDVIKQKIREAGYSIEEVTGRTRQVEFPAKEEGSEFEPSDVAKVKISRRKKGDVSKIIADFNENKTDCLIINQSGATGVSMHSVPNTVATVVYETPPLSLQNKKEVKARAMVICQMELDINKEVQKLGRINRTGQVYEPSYTYVVSAIPSESRLSAMMEKKLRSLSANVSADQEQSSHLFSSDDFFSEIAIEPFNETMKDIGEGGTQITKKEQIYEYTKLLYFRDFKLQKDFYTTFSTRLTNHIAELIKQKLYTGKMETRDYKAESLGVFPFFIGDKNAKTSFGSSGIMERNKVTLYGEKNIESNISATILDKLKSYEKNRFEEVQYNDYKLYKISAQNHLSELAKQINEGLEKTRIDAKEKKVAIDAVLEDYKIKLAAFKEIQIAIEAKENLAKVKSEISEKSALIPQLAMDGKMDEMQVITNEIGELQKKKSEAEKEYLKHEPLLERKSEFDDAKRGVKDYEEKKEAQDGALLREEADVAEKNRIIQIVLGYVNNIGKIFDYKTFSEDKDWDDSGVMSYTYAEEFSEPVVLVGVDIPQTRFDLRLGDVKLSLKSVTKTHSTSLSPIHKLISEDDVEGGRKHTAQFINSNVDYKKKWNEIAGNTDTSYTEERYIINGSALKNFILSRGAGYRGHIVKYSTNKNNTRIGIEIPNKNTGTATSPMFIYDLLNNKYSEGSAESYPVYFDSTSENFKKYIVDYIYYMYFGNIYDAVEKQKDIKDTNAFLALDMSRYADYVMCYQLSSAQSTTIFKFCPNSILKDKINETITQYKSIKDFGVVWDSSFNVELDFLISNIQVKIISDTVKVTNLFAQFAKREGVEIDSGNYIFAKKNAAFPEIEPRTMQKYLGAEITSINATNLFETVFPVDITNMGKIANMNYAGRLMLGMDTFVKINDALIIQNAKLTLSTSSKYFKYLGESVTGFWDNEVEVASVDENADTDFVSALSDEQQKEIDMLIDNLVNSLR